MTSKTSQELKAEITDLFYGIDPKTQLMECVSLSRGGILTLARAGRDPRSYRIRNGRPPAGEIARVFGLTQLSTKNVRPVSAGWPTAVNNLGEDNG